MQNIPKTFKIPSDAEVVFVSDFFVENLIGGAELTHDAIIQKCPKKLFKLHSQSFTPELIEANTDKYWILGNNGFASKDALITMATCGAKFSIIECDYRYCQFRSSHLHKLQTGQECDCHLKDHGRFAQGLFKRAEHTFFMSEGQMNEYKKLFPKMALWPEDKLQVQGSTISDEGLEQLQSLFKEYPDKNGKWAVLQGGTWIKNQQETEAYCKATGKEYELIGGLPPKEFLNKLATYSGLVFHPKGFDTNPRITIEAKLLGLQLDLNDNVQQKNDPWFTGTREETLDYLKGLAKNFWERI